MPRDVAELVCRLGDSSLRVGGRDDEQDSALHHDGSVLVAFSLDWTGKMESVLMPMFSITLAGITVS